MAALLGQSDRALLVRLAQKQEKGRRALGTMDASLAVLIGQANPNKIMRKYFRQSQSRNFSHLLNGGLLTMAGGTISDLRQITTFASDTLRQEAIKFDGIRSTAAYLFGILFGALRVGLFLGALVLLYDFLHQYHYGLVDEIDQNIGEFDELTELLPADARAERAGRDVSMPLGVAEAGDDDEAV